MIYLNPTTSQNPLFSMPRGTILSIDNMIDSTEGVWIHVFIEKGQENDPKSPVGSGCVRRESSQSGCWLDGRWTIPSACPFTSRFT